VKDQSKTKQTLIQELSFLRQRIVELEQSESERKLAERVLRESEALLHSLIGYMHDAMIILNWDGSILFANRAAARIIEYEQPEEFIGHNMVEYLHPDSFQKAAEDLEAVKADKMGFLSEYQLCSVTGRPIWVESIGGKIIFRNASANLVCIRDITERKRADELLRQTEENFRRSLDDSPLGVRIVTEEGETIYANRAILDIYGYDSIEELRTTPVKKRYTPESYAQFQIRKEKRKRRGDGTSEYEISIVKKDGEVCRLHVFRKEILWNGKRQFQVIYQDITERKLVEEQLHASLREKELLLREVHHRVKNNMQVITGLLDLQAASSGNQELIEMLNESQRRIQAMALIHEKLYDSKDFARIDMAGYVRTLSQELFQSYKINPVKIDLIIQTDGVYVDINKAIPCGLILNELISNALKHAFPGDRRGELQIIIRETKNTEIEIVVRDNGLSLPDDVDLHQPRTVGLHLVNGLVKNQLDGQMEVRRDNGTEFRIKFPL